jgi:hypothetical protein
VNVLHWTKEQIFSVNEIMRLRKVLTMQSGVVSSIPSVIPGKSRSIIFYGCLHFLQPDAAGHNLAVVVP